MTTQVTTGVIADSAVTPAKLSQPLTQGTAQATTSGTTKDFTAIPSWAKRITLVLSGVSTSGASLVQAQLGSGSFTTSGYSQLATTTASAGSPTFSSASTGFIVSPNSSSTSLRTGVIVFTNVTGNTWVAEGKGAETNGSTAWTCDGSITLAGALDRVRLTTVNGTDAFDAGNVNIFYEG